MRFDEDVKTPIGAGHGDSIVRFKDAAYLLGNLAQEFVRQVEQQRRKSAARLRTRPLHV